ncbi:hypothetical protein BC835DRAFT_1422304 [Cytidiella melzeri]|nr:hypothetical protein BC835DRAFT_1422304 [Cytidiella melzeri]
MHFSSMVTLALIATIGPAASVPIPSCVVSSNTPLDTSSMLTIREVANHTSTPALDKSTLPESHNWPDNQEFSAIRHVDSLPGEQELEMTKLEMMVSALKAFSTLGAGFVVGNVLKSVVKAVMQAHLPPKRRDEPTESFVNLTNPPSSWELQNSNINDLN